MSESESPKAIILLAEGSIELLNTVNATLSDAVEESTESVDSNK